MKYCLLSLACITQEQKCAYKESFYLICILFEFMYELLICISCCFLTWYSSVSSSLSFFIRVITWLTKRCNATDLQIIVRKFSYDVSVMWNKILVFKECSIKENWLLEIFVFAYLERVNSVLSYISLWNYKKLMFKYT